MPPLDTQTQEPDVEQAAQQQDLQDQYERQQAGITPGVTPASFQRTAPGVYAPVPDTAPAPTTGLPATGITPKPAQSRRAPSISDLEKLPTTAVYGFDQQEAPPKDSFTSDLGHYLGGTLQNWGGSALGFGKFLNDATIDSPGLRDKLDSWTAGFAKGGENQFAKMSPSAQNAARADILRTFNIGPDTDEQGNHIPSPFEAGIGTYLAQRLAPIIAPAAALYFLPEGAVAVTAEIATALLFGSMTAGEGYNKVSDLVNKLPDAELRKESEPYEAFRAGGMPVDEAKGKLKVSTWSSVLATFAAGTAAGFGFGKVLRPGPSTGFLASRAIGAGEGAATFGLQSAASNAGGQLGMMQTGIQKDFDTEALARETAAGAVGGSLFGIAAARRAPKPEEAPPPHPDVDPAAQSALAAAGIYNEPAGPKEVAGPPSPPQGQLDLGSAPPGPPAGSPQGEMFPTVQEANRPTNTVGTGLTEAPTPTPPPGPADQQAGMVGARQQELPINQTPPTMVAATGQGEMFPSLPEANPPVAQVTPFRGDEPPPPPPGTPPPGGGGGAPAATQAAVKTSQAKTPPAPTGERPSGTMKKAELNDALVGMGIDTKGMNRDDMARRFDREQARAPSTPTPPDTTVVKGPPTAPARETAPGPEAATQAAPPTQGALTPPASEGVRFTTEKGSTYQVHDDGTTTRDKAARPEHPGEQGPQPRSERTVYVTPEEATRLGGDFQTQGGAAKEIAEHSSGALGVRYTEGKDAGKFERRTMVKHTTEPEVGKVPVELWGGGKRAHFGNKITEIAKGEPTAKISTGVRPEGGAPPGSDEHLAGATAEVTPEVKPKEDPRETAIGHLAAAKQRVLAEARANGAPVRKGSPAEKAINAAMEEMQRAFSDPKQDPGDVMKMLHTDARRGTPNEGETIAAYAARRALVSGMLKEITGNEKFKLPPLKLKEVADTRSEIEQVRAEEQQRGGEEATRKATTSEAVEEKATGASETGETTGAEAVDEKLPKGTSIPVKAKKLVQQILDPQHAMDVPTAEKILAKTSNLGRPRTKGFGDLHDAFETEWKRITGEAGQKIKAKLEAELARLDRQQPMTEEDTQGRVLEEQQHDRTVAKVQKQLEEYAPERLIAMAKAMKEIADPIKDAADARDALLARKAELEGGSKYQLSGSFTPTSRPPTSDGIDPRSSRFLGLHYDPRLNDFIHRDLAASEQSGVPYTLHDALRATINHSGVRVEMRPLWQLARMLLSRAKDVEIHTPENLLDRGYIDRDEHRVLSDPGVAGAYADAQYGDPAHIVLNPRADDTSHVQTLIHEGLHRVLNAHVENLLKTDPNHAHLQALRAISLELAKYRTELPLGGAAREAINNMQGNPHEVATYLMSNPELMSLATSKQASPELIATLRRLGLDAQPKQSVWRTFVNTARRALGMDAPRSASEYTLFDHAMRPLSHIIEHAVDYNERILPQDPQLRARAEPLYRTVSSSMGDRTRNMLERMDPAGMGDRARRAIMGVVNRDAFVDWNKDVQPGLVDWRTADENIRARSNEFAAKYGDKVQELLGRIHKADNKDNLSNLMVDVGIHEAHVGGNLTEAEKRVNARSPEAANLQRVYDKLSPKDRALYDDVKDLNKRMYADERAAQVESLLNGYMPDATPEQREAFTTGVKSENSLAKFLTDPDNSEIARAFGDKWATERQIATGMARLHGMGFVHGDYFPLRRFGNYVVRYGDEKTPANYGVEMFDSYTKANQRRAELIRSGRTDVLQVARKDDTHLSNLTSKPAFADELSSAMKRKGYDAAQIEHVNNLMNDILLRHATHSEAARAQLSRRGVRGASTDQTRVLSADFLSKQMRIGYMAHGLDRARRLGEMRDQVDALERSSSAAPGAAVRAMSIYQEAAKRMTRPEEHDNILRRVGATANAFSFVQSLMSVSHMLTSTLETHGNSMALLGARYGYTRTALALSRALADASPALAGGARNTIKALGNRLKTSDWNMLQAVIDEMKSKPGSDPRLLDMLGKEAVRTGIIDHTYLQDIRQSMSPAGNIGTGAQKVWDIFYNSNAAMAHAVDVTNKLGVLTAVARMEMRRPGVTREQAVAQAIQMTRRVMPNYTVGNRERIAAGPIGSTLLQFKRYGMHMYALMGNLINESMHGPNKAESMKALAGILGTHAAMAGVLTLIADPLRYIGGAYDIATGAPKFHDYQNDVRGFLASTFGPQVAEIMARGLPHAMGMDLHRRVGLANLLEVPEMDGFNKQGAAQVLLGLATGATGENLQNLVDGASKFLHGDWGGTMKAMAPRPFRDIYKGIDAATEGIKDSTGKVIMSPDKVGVSGAITQALGIQPSQVSEFRERRAAILEARQEQSATHTQLSNAWLANPAKRPEIWQKIQAFNRDNRGVAITRDQLMRTLNQRRKDEQVPGAAGLRLPRKGAKELIRAGAFANVQ